MLLKKIPIPWYSFRFKLYFSSHLYNINTKKDTINYPQTHGQFPQKPFNMKDTSYLLYRQAFWNIYSDWQIKRH